MQYFLVKPYGKYILPAAVTVIVVNYNGGDLIHRCLLALRKQEYRDFSVIVVDNLSEDSSVNYILADFPEVLLMRMQANLGFAGGVNYALKHMQKSRWIALLNPDAFPSPFWLKELVHGAIANPDFSAFGSRMFSEISKKYLDGTGDAYHISGLHWREGHGKVNSGCHGQAHEIFSPCAAAALYDAVALNAVGAFDEDFFCYAEDIDFGFRMRLFGYKALYLPEAIVVHIGSAITGKQSAFQIYHGHRNLVWTYIKNMPGFLFWVFLPLHILANLLFILLFALKGKGNIVFKAKVDAVLQIPYFWNKRLEIQKNRSVKILEILKILRWNLFDRK